MGDILPKDLKNPERVKTMWNIAKRTIDKQKRTIRYLRTKNNRLKKKVNSLEDVIGHLKENKRISPDCYSVLQVCIVGLYLLACIYF